MKFLCLNGAYGSADVSFTFSQVLYVSFTNERQLEISGATRFVSAWL